MYKGIADVDKVYARSITSFMCTDFCICPGTPADQWWKDYDKIEEETYNKWGRSKLVGTGESQFNGEINLDRFAGSTEYKPLFFAYDPQNENKAKPSLVELQSETFQKCMENSDNIVAKYKEQVEALSTNTFGSTQISSDSSSSKADQFAAMSRTVEKPEEKYLDLLKFIENRYSCSGLCTASLFYFTLSVKKGPPTQACLPPLIGEVAEPVGNLGAAMIASAVFFILVSIFVWPVCCF